MKLRGSTYETGIAGLSSLVRWVRRQASSQEWRSPHPLKSHPGDGGMTGSHIPCFENCTFESVFQQR